ncbi:uncharacterized protein PV09_02349 [Verruconis gallopava]|uniref:Uncharacterized protein n=1 Tax=Verruconis gallopava TaxID=253628 RepID=A0A0D1Z0Z3_9PEZI|nr:uncharacterized protein PV09_02349 [Verruconis gallopava]KIW06637.1 hypothetical protein PV09_02349 [Verruconis gallopava]
MAALRQSVQRSYFRFSTFNVPRATFSTSARLAAVKEDKLHTEGRGEEIETHKQDQLKKKKEGKQHWQDELASNSESIIKAERGEIDASSETIQKLQEESAKAAKQKV